MSYSRNSIFPKIVTDGLVLYLDAGNRRSYPGSGDTWYDLTKYNNNGTLTNGPTFNSADEGSIVFDGVNDYVPVISPYSLITGGTMNIWFKRTGNGLNLNVVIGSYGGSGNQRSPTIYGTSNINWEFGSQGSGTGVSFTLNTWFNATITYDSLFNAIIYINSIQKDSFTSLNPGGFLSSEWIGSYGSSGNSAFQGNIALVQAYNRALTAQEVLQNYDALKYRFGL